jgi:hypothetical protein
LDNLELNFLAFFKCLEAFGIDGGKMDKYVVFALN